MAQNMAQNMMFSSLPLDILDKVLTSLTDYDTLSAAIRVNKALYDAFQTRHTSIVRAIAYNVAGSALPVALRFAKGTLADPWPSEEECADPSMHITRNEATLLVNEAQVAHDLEDIFSWRWKDRTSSTSRLTPAESVRFHNACYRFWSYCRAWEDEHQEWNIDEHDEQYDEARHWFESLPTAAVVDIDRVTSFFGDILQWAVSAHYPPVTLPRPLDAFIAEGEALVKAFRSYGERPVFEYVSSEFRDGFFDGMLHSVLETRRLLPKRGELQAKAILSSVASGQDKCYRCDSTIVFADWGPFGPGNFRLAKGELNPEQLVQSLPGNLARNTADTPALRACLAGLGFTVAGVPLAIAGAVDHPCAKLAPRAGIDYAELLAELLELPALPDEDLGPHERPWVLAEGTWYCVGCLGALASQRLWRWWLERQRKANMVLPENCWYGWNCRTQVHNSVHAAKLNHFCKPIRGE